MTKKKTIGMGLAILGIVFLIYNMLVFLILTPQTPVFWISYGFMVLAFGLQVLGMYMSFKDFDVQAIFFGIPLAQFTLFYFFAELFMSAVFMIFQNIPWKIPVILQVILLAVYAVVAIVSEETGSISVAVDGMLKRHLAPETLDRLLRQELIPEPTESVVTKLNFLERFKKKEGGLDD